MKAYGRDVGRSTEGRRNFVDSRCVYLSAWLCFVPYGDCDGVGHMMSQRTEARAPECAST